MRKWLKTTVAALGGAALGGCAASSPSPPPVNIGQAMLSLQLGKPVLRCREACLAAWREAEPHAGQLAAKGQWWELAETVIRVGYQDDLTLYYLGRATEGLGYPKAATSYYRQSMELSGTSISCTYMSRQCSGVALPHEASLRLGALDNELNRPRPARRPVPSPGQSPTPEAPGSEVQPPSVEQPSAEAPPPEAIAPPAATIAPLPATIAPPAVVPPAMPRDTTQFIEPPPSIEPPSR
jgi:hypothetical protein